MSKCMITKLDEVVLDSNLPTLGGFIFAVEPGKNKQWFVPVGSPFNYIKVLDGDVELYLSNDSSFTTPYKELIGEKNYINIKSTLGGKILVKDKYLFNNISFSDTSQSTEIDFAYDLLRSIDTSKITNNLHLTGFMHNKEELQKLLNYISTVDLSNVLRFQLGLTIKSDNNVWNVVPIENQTLFENLEELQLWDGTIYQHLNYDIEAFVKKFKTLKLLTVNGFSVGFDYSFEMDNVIDVWKDIMPAGHVVKVSIGYGKVYWTSQGKTSLDGSVKKSITFNGDGTYTIGEY